MNKLVRDDEHILRFAIGLWAIFVQIFITLCTSSLSILEGKLFNAVVFTYLLTVGVTYISLEGLLHHASACEIS